MGLGSSQRFMRCQQPECRVPLGVALQRAYDRNLNPNRQVGSMFRQKAPIAEEAASMAFRQRTFSRPTQAWGNLPSAPAFAQVLYFAFAHARMPGMPIVQSQLASGIRYKLMRPQSERVMMEHPQVDMVYCTDATEPEILAALPGNNLNKRELMQRVATWWLGEERGADVLADALALPPQVYDRQCCPQCCNV